MCKREVIDEILRINLSAKPAFLAEFSLEDLDDYLQHLRAALTPRPMAGLYGVSPVPARLDGHGDAGDELQVAESAQGATLF